MEPTKMNDLENLDARAPRQTFELANAFVILRPKIFQMHEKADY